MITSLVALLGPFILNAAVSLAKRLGNLSSTPVIRFVLALFSLVGVICYSALNGTPLDVNSVTSIVGTLFLSASIFRSSRHL
ncbi:hypothetical protein XH80_02915 [Bradyrhizobium sp. CCBAU 45384]|nr:hypothetical protein [Bradyrhizobium sp. CCBAU 45384]